MYWQNGFTPLHLASQEGHTDMVTLLLDRRANSNSRAKNGLTPMHLAAQEDHVPVAEILVKYKAQIDPQTKVWFRATVLSTKCCPLSVCLFISVIIMIVVVIASWSWTVEVKYEASPDITILCNFHSISYTQTSPVSGVVQPPLCLSSSASFSLHRAKWSTFFDSRLSGMRQICPDSFVFLCRTVLMIVFCLLGCCLVLSLVTFWCQVCLLSASKLLDLEQLGYWHQRADERHGNPPPR